MRPFGDVAPPPDHVENGHYANADKATEKCPEENGKKRAADSQKSANHRHHFDVTQAHTLALSDKFVERSGAPEEQAAEEGAEERIEDSKKDLRPGMQAELPGQNEGGRVIWRDTDGKRERETKAKPVHGIRKKTHADVGDDQNDQQALEEEELEGRKSDSERVTGEDKEHPGEEFNDRVHRRDGKMAGTAFAVKQEPAEHRDVVVRFDGCFAPWTTRSGRNNRNSFRNAGDADIQEAADDDAKEEEKEGDHRIECAIGEETAQCAWRGGVSDG